MIPVLLLALSGCMMIREAPEIQSLSEPLRESPSAVPVALAVLPRVYQDGLHLRTEETREQQVLSFRIVRALKEADLLSGRLAGPAPEALNVLVETVEDRSGPVGLRVLSALTFRLLPAWIKVHYTLEATGVYAGREIEAFRYEARATEVEHMALLPVAPFLPPEAGRARMRQEAVQALVMHLRCALARISRDGKKEAP